MFKKAAPPLFISLITVLVLFSFAGCGKSAAPAPQIEILSHNMTVQKFGTAPDSVAVVTGTAKNISGYTIQKAMIEATYYDENGKIIGTSTSSIDNLAPGILWNFTTQLSSPNAWKIVNYKLNVK
jgi:hypothetical protein